MINSIKRAIVRLNFCKAGILLVVFFCCSLSLLAQDTIPYLGANEIGTGKIITFTRLKGSQLNTYKGFDPAIYYEYGIKEMLVQEIVHNQILIRVEYYLMKDSAAAFGIFSVNRQKCSRQGAITRFDCLNMQKAQFVLGKLYVNVSGQFSHAEVGKSCETLAKTIARKCWYQGWDYPQFFDYNTFYPYLNKVMLIRGETGFYRYYPEWAEKFKGLGCEVVLLPVDFNKSSCAVAKVTFRNMMEMNTFISQNGLESRDTYGAYTNTKGKTKQFLMISGTKEVLFMESWGKSEEVDNFRFQSEQRIRNFVKGAKAK